MTNPRPGWPQRMLRLAQSWAQYSTCLRSQVGAVLFDPDSKAVISIGYNDTAIGRDDCGEGGCPACAGTGSARNLDDCNCVHAETNCIALAARRGARTEGAHIAVTRTPCNGCRKLLEQAGVTKIFGEDFSESSA